ncbi:GDSL esterase/lipase EXL3-like isoform X1 [Quercus robur]|uniref:GDSL esterase/lipase EXL3-like isoform X1 n=1 Tax=Quercus robur TaxID=38942 RepID=UPI002161FA29|nr:GDSL esterase/lipase EXL3-like isoform X1 [Quercus robur]
MHSLFVNSHPCSILLFNLILLVLFYNTTAVIKLPPNETYPAIFVFGDSTVDTGNNNNRITPSRANYSPYGNDFKGKVATGRFSNGKVPSDMIAAELEIKELLPAYLDPNLQTQDLITGVCFASGGSGYDPLTPKIALTWSMSDQLGMLKEYIVRLQGIVGVNRTNFILTRSLYLISLSSCDIANVYFGPTSRRYKYDFASYTDLMLKYATQFLKELYSLGARRIGVFGAPPIGCVPSQRTVAGGLHRQCGEGHNQLAMLFNAKLTTLLDSLNKDMPDSRMVYLDIYNPLLDLIEHPEKNGFKIAEKGCCGTGIIEVGPICNPLSAICTDVNDYVFWDSFHPTERAYKIITSQVLKNDGNRLFGHQ